MFKRKATIEQSNKDEQADAREKIDVALHRLQALKDKISEIRHQCEELKNQLSGNQVSESQVHGNHVSGNHVSGNHVSGNHVSGTKVSLCSECGNAIEPNQEVVVKDSAGIERRHYHMKCFQTLFR